MVVRLKGPNSRTRNATNPDRVMSITAHLDELRSRIIRAGLWTILLASGLAFKWRLMMHEILLPWQLARIPESTAVGHLTLLTLSPTEPLFTVINVILAVAVVLASPIWIYEAWQFLGPTVPLAHRPWILRALLIGLILFWTGVAVAFFGVIPASLRFLLLFAQGVFSESVRASAYLGFVTSFSLAIGAVFTVPVWLGIAVKLGWITPARLRRGRRIAFFLSAVFAAAVVPSQDPLTLLAVILPVYGLYEATIQVSRWIRPLDW